LFFEIAMGIAGAGYGLYQAGERKWQLEAESRKAGLMYDAVKKRNKAQLSILEGNMTVGAISNTENNKAAAVQEFQNRSMQEAALGVSGISSGTPFYLMDSEAAANRKKLDDISTKGQFQLAGQGAEYAAAKASGKVSDMEALNQYQDIAEQASYSGSSFAYTVAGLSGALSGASMGANISTLTKSVFKSTVDELVGGAAKGIGGLFKKPSTEMTQQVGEMLGLPGYSSGPSQTQIALLDLFKWGGLTDSHAGMPGVPAFPLVDTLDAYAYGPYPYGPPMAVDSNPITSLMPKVDFRNMMKNVMGNTVSMETERMPLIPSPRGMFNLFSNNLYSSLYGNGKSSATPIINQSGFPSIGGSW